MRKRTNVIAAKQQLMMEREGKGGEHGRSAGEVRESQRRREISIVKEVITKKRANDRIGKVS